MLDFNTNFTGADGDPLGNHPDLQRNVADHDESPRHSPQRQILSVVPAGAATPAEASATPAAATRASQRRPDVTLPNFLAQFKSALKTLANVGLPQITNPRSAAAHQNGPLMSTAPEARAASEHGQPVEPEMPALLAELGFAVVPTAFVTPPMAATTGTGSPGQ